MKKIVLLSDGTGNSAAKKNKTNVWRLYRALDLHRPDQIAMYDDGVGSQKFLIFKILGGGFGWGLKQNVIELYKFLCRTYKTDRTDEGSDKIYLFGFSRGAFTVRILAGLIAECGLCTDNVSERDLDKKVRHNYSVYRNRFRRWTIFGLFACNRHRQAYTTIRPTIEFIGVWDTVDAYGFPIDELAELWDKFIYPIRFPDQQLSGTVLKACHAVSIDDERHSFHPVLWDESKESEPNRIEQVWFSGVHADVGGGYPHEALSLVSLDWMISKVEANESNQHGLHFIGALRDEYLRRSDWHGRQHNSRAGFAAYYRYKPRNIDRLCNDPDAGTHGVKIAVPKIHRGVFERIKGNIVPYAPTGLPVTYEIVSTRGPAPKFEGEDEKKARVAAMDGALDVIYWRRWLYRAFLLTTLMLIISPFFLEWVADAPCRGVVCSLDPLFVSVRDLLPDFAACCIEAFRQNSVWLWLLIFAFLYLILRCLRLRTLAKTLDRATKAWSAVKNKMEPPPWSPTRTAKLRIFLKSEGRKRFRRVWLMTVFVFILAVVFVVSSRVLFHIRDSAGCLCQPSSATNPTTGWTLINFDAEESCLPTKVILEAGKTYRFEVRATSTWTDGTLPAGPDGLENDPPLEMHVFTPFRRHIAQPWFELTGRIGHSGREIFTIGSEACYTARSDGELYLYVNDAVIGFLPDPYWAWPYFWSEGPNSGEANVIVTPVKRSSACERPDSCEVSCPAPQSR